MKIFQPAIAMMNNLKYPQKFLLISIIFSLPIVTMLVLLIIEIYSRVDFTQREIMGNQYLQTLSLVWRANLNGKIAIPNQSSNFQAAAVQAPMAKLRTLNQSLRHSLKTDAVFNVLEEEINSLSLVDNRQNSFRYQQITQTIQKLRSLVGETSNLILDPNLDTYYLMEALLRRLPEMQNMLTEINMITQVIINQGNADQLQIAKLIQMTTLLRDENQSLITSLQSAILNNPLRNLEPAIANNLFNLNDEVRKFTTALDQVITGSQLPSPQLLIQSEEIFNELFEFEAQAASELNVLLNHRISSLIQRQILISVFVLLILITVVYLFIGFYQSVMQTVKCLDMAAKRMTNGDAGVLEVIELNTQDELATVVNAFNRIAGALVEAIAQAKTSEVKYRSIFENAIEGIFQTSPDGKYISVNPALVNMYGYSSAAELISAYDDLSSQLYVNPQRRQEFIELINQKGQVVKFESEIYCQDNSKIWISENARAVTDDQGAVLYYEGSVRDISDRIAAEKSLEQANLSIRLLNEQLKAENMRMSAELSISRKLQQMILPRPEELSKIRELDISGYMEPATEVGGDYYDILVEDGGRIKIGIGDVTGHGLESSVLMIMVQTAVRTLLVSNETDPVKFLNILNRTIYDNAKRMESGKNLTLALIDYEAGKLTVSGQHEELLLIRSTGTVERIDTIDLGFPIGLEPQISEFIHKTEVQLCQDDVAILYTDGVSEAENMEKQQYGIERLCQVVKQYSQRSAEAIRQAVIADLRQFIGEQQVFDDITLLVIKKR